MCDAIRHRGPDDEGVYTNPAVGLGMRRLSIIDLAGGHQPIFNEDGSKAVVFNGEIYNYRDLRRELLARGHQLRTNSDTETIVHLYEDYGADCVSRLRGMFAFALWDDTTGTLLLARDRFGIKPLYVVVDDEGVAFGSELKALLRLPGLDRRLDWDALEQYFQFGYIPAPYSPFAAVRKLEPGHSLVWRRDGSCQDRRYWDIPVGIERPRTSPEEVLEWIDESVSAHLVSDVPLAVFLSGGLDSSAVFSSMAMTGVRPHAFTARYHGSGAQSADESHLAQELVTRYGARLTVVDVEPKVTDLLEPIMYALDEPHADESAIPSWLLSQRVAAEYKVILSGTGGDELFAGYRRHLGLLASEWYTALPAAARSLLSVLAARIPEPRSGELTLHRIKRFVRTTPGNVPDRYYALLTRFSDLSAERLFAPDINRSISGRPALDHLRSAYAAGGHPRGLQAALYLDYRTYLPDDILHLSDRIAMAHSLEVRVPFVDHVLVERAFPLPDRVKIGRGRPKQLLRRAISGRLTRAHMTAPKRGFVGPTAVWLRNELRPMLLDELSPSRLDRLGFFDSRVVSELVEDHMTRRHNREGPLWALLSFSVWHRVFLESRPAPDLHSNQPAVVA
jgi:asparagine synthase (glutamine-hydrolysing)